MDRGDLEYPKDINMRIVGQWEKTGKGKHGDETQGEP